MGMRRAAAFFILFCVALGACTHRPDSPGAAGNRFELATPEQAAAAISAHDEYLSALSPADLSIWLRRADDQATVTEMANFLAANVRAWDEPERARLDAMRTRITTRLAPLADLLPRRILIASITPEASEGQAFTRGATIFLAQLPTSDAALDELFFHETFHVLSRANPRLRAALYGVIGFVGCEPMALPIELRARLLTNPDAPSVDFAAPVSDTDRSLLVTPLLLADPPRYDPRLTSFFGDYLDVQYMPLRQEPSGRCSPAQDVNFTQEQLLEAILARAGRNTDYTFHPEEIMADNFAQMMMGRANAPNPEVYDRLAAVLGIARP